MATKSKLELLMVLSDKLFNNKLAQVQSRLSGATDKMDAKLNKFSGNQIKIAAGVAAAFAAIGGFALITAGIGKSIDATAKFDSAFLPIKQLNLEKSKGEMASYRDLIRDSAYEVGTSLEASTTAFYDLQSATAVYGQDAAEIFKKVGRYSVATGADLNNAMNSTTKSMKAFGYGVGDIDKLLEANAKTVLTGITTFDELARVQTKYAGATSAAGQTVETGNKIFAMFTSIAEGSDVAANKTKTFFDGLGQQSDNIKKYLNVDVFDSSGKMKEADKLLVEISKKFKTMNDQQITETINKIGGPEGLRDALAKAKTGADDMFATFNAFDTTKFSLSDALKNTDGDFASIKTAFYNRLEMVFSKIGEKIIPVLANIFDKLAPVLEMIYNNIDWLLPAIGTFATVLGVLTAAVWLFNIATAANPIGLVVIAIAAVIALIAVVITKWDEWGAALSLFMGPVGVVIGAFKSIYDHWESIKQAFQTDGILGGLKRIGIVLLDAVLKPMQKILEVVAEYDPTGLATAGLNTIKAFRESSNLVTPGEKEAQEKLGKNVLPESLNKAPDATNDKKGGKNLKKEGEQINKTVGQANQVRNITIKIDSFNKGGINVAQSSYAGMSKDDVEAWFKEMLRRVVINAETA